MYYSVDSIVKRMANRHNAMNKSANISDIAYLVDCVALMNAPDVQGVDDISVQSAEVQQILRSVYDRIVDADARLGIVILDDDTIRCITSSSHVSQYDGCKYWEISVHMDR